MMYHFGGLKDMELFLDSLKSASVKIPADDITLKEIIAWEAADYPLL